MKKTKWLVLLLIASLSIVIAACGSSNKAQQSNNSTSSTGTSTGTATEAPKPELKTLQSFMTDDYNTYPVAKLLEERTGYKVQYESLPADKPQEKLNLLIASGDPYDIITIGGGSDNKALYADYAKRGALVDLTPLIEEYGPNIKASLSEETLEAAKVDGKLYAIPTRTIEFTSTSLMIRKDWLDKLGLQMPTTLDELTYVLQEFKDKDPGGNGATNVAMTINGDIPMVDNILGAFGLENGWNNVDGKLVTRAMDPAFKDYLAYMADLYDQGLLDKEFPVNKDSTAKEKFSSGKAGILPLHWADIPGITDALQKNHPDAEIVFVPALKGKDGKAGFTSQSGFDRITFIPKASKNHVDAIKWIDAKLEQETFKLMTIGEEGTHHTFENGAYTPILPIFNDERNQSTNYLTGIDEINFPIYWQARVRKDMRLFAGWEFLNITQPAEVRIPDPLGLAPYLEQFSKNNAQLGQLSKDFTIKVIVGGEPLTSVDSFVEKYKAEGGEASELEVNEWYATVRQ